MQNQLLWYIRRVSTDGGDIRGVSPHLKSAEVKGPFPDGLVSRYILLGRVRLTDEVSVDREIWRPVKEVAELIPEIMVGDASDPVAQERLNAAKRWADERLARDRRADQPDNPEFQSRRAGERRQAEPAVIVQHRAAKTKRSTEEKDLKASPRSRGYGMFMAVGGISLLVLALIYMPRDETKNILRDCLAAAHPKVDWSGCKMEGAQLEGANLQEAQLREIILNGASLQQANITGADLSYAVLNFSNLRLADARGALLQGASLRGANLANANLRGANLSYADFSGADLSGVDLEGAILDNAIWIDESRCAPQSLGRCLKTPMLETMAP